MADGKPRRILRRNRTFASVDFAIGVSVSSYKQISREGAPKWRRPVDIVDIETGVTVKFRSQTFKMERYCARGRAISFPGTRIGCRDMGEEYAPNGC